MLSNHLQNGIEAPKLAWSRLPNSDDAENDVLVGLRKKDDSDGAGVESLDYEVIENYAYWEEQAQRGKLYVGYYVAVKWFFALLISIGTGLAAVFINISVENFACWKFALTFAIIQKSYFVRGVHINQLNFGLFICIYHYTIRTGSSRLWYSRNQGVFKWGRHTWCPTFQNIDRKDIWEHWFSGRRSSFRQRRSSCSYWCLYCFVAWTTIKLDAAWPVVESSLKDYGISCDLDVDDLCVKAWITRRTGDRYIIDKAWDLLELFSKTDVLASTKIGARRQPRVKDSRYNIPAM